MPPFDRVHHVDHETGAGVGLPFRGLHGPARVHRVRQLAQQVVVDPVPLVEFVAVGAEDARAGHLTRETAAVRGEENARLGRGIIARESPAHRVLDHRQGHLDVVVAHDEDQMPARRRHQAGQGLPHGGEGRVGVEVLHHPLGRVAVEGDVSRDLVLRQRVEHVAVHDQGDLVVGAGLGDTLDEARQACTAIEDLEAARSAGPPTHVQIGDDKELVESAEIRHVAPFSFVGCVSSSYSRSTQTGHPPSAWLSCNTPSRRAARRHRAALSLPSIPAPSPPA